MIIPHMIHALMIMVVMPIYPEGLHDMITSMICKIPIDLFIILKVQLFLTSHY